jgi:hypothetical protein
MEQRELSGRARLPQVMERALEVAVKGDCLAIADVLVRVDRDDAVTLKLWAGVQERDKINRACREGIEKRRIKFGIQTGRTKRPKR